MPWSWKPARPRLPGVSPIPVSDSPPPPADEVRDEPKKRRRPYITPSLIEKLGYTPGCPGCEKVLKGVPGATGKTHSERCRARIYKAMDEEDERIQRLPEGAEESEGVRRRLEDQPAQVGERSPADAGGSRKRPAEVSMKY